MLKQEWRALQWVTPEERKRKRELDNARDDWEDDPYTFNALEACGHRSPEDLLPMEKLESFITYQIVKEDAEQWEHLVRNKTFDFVIELFAFKRTILYLSLEEDDK